MSNRSFIALLMVAMAAGTISGPAFGVLSEYLRQDLEITRTQFGLGIGGIALFGAVVSPFSGAFVDRVGARRGIIGIFMISALGMLVLSASRSFAAVAGFALAAGVAQSLANPATNRAIVFRMRQGQRGLSTGLKQSGVQAGVFLTGAALPSLALVTGWRLAIALLGGLLAMVALAVGISKWPGVDDRAADRGGSGRGRRPVRRPSSATSRVTRVLATYGALLGLSAGFVNLMPLYASDVAGFGPQLGGGLVAVAGVVAFIGRTTWASLAERRGMYYTLLAALAVGSALASMLALVGAIWSPVLWLTAVTIGLTAGSWNAVGMVTIMKASEADQRTGYASGWVYFGFLLGVSLTGPTVGMMRDRLGSYVPALSVLAAASLAGAITALHGRRFDKAVAGGSHRPGTHSE